MNSHSVLIQTAFSHGFVFYGCSTAIQTLTQIRGIEIAALAGYQSTREIHARIGCQNKPAGDHFDPRHSVPVLGRNTYAAAIGQLAGTSTTTQTFASRTLVRDVTV